MKARLDSAHARPSGGAQAPGRTWRPELVERRHPLALDYRLVVMTDGRPCLRETLEAWRQLASPQPSSVFLHDDGGQALEWGGGTAWANVPYWHERSAEQLGFCRSVSRSWAAAAFPGPEWIVWLEDDFVLRRPLDLEELAAVMIAEPQLAQMALYRTPYSDEEKALGGYLKDPARDYEPRETDGHRWFEHRHYWTTNPSLFRRAVAQQCSWPAGPECEGRFGVDLLRERLSVTFGVWGAGEVWVNHVGDRLGSGY